MTAIFELKPHTSEEVAEMLAKEGLFIALGKIYVSRVSIRMMNNNIIHGIELLYVGIDESILDVAVAVTSHIKQREPILNLQYL